jgi:hypothetical protein
MKWLCNPKKEAKLGSQRQVAKFALFPTYAYSYKNNFRYLIWLKSYHQVQEYKRICNEYHPGIGMIFDDEWVKIENMIP